MSVFAPKITVITPSYNQGRYIEETIQSVINQEYPNIEYIIIDGGSSDNTIDIIKKYENKIDYWVSEPDKGQSDAINKGIIRATGDIVAWLNSDDQYYSDQVFKRVSELFLSNEDAFVCYGDNVYIDENSNLLYMRKAPKYFFIGLLKVWNYIHQPAVFMRRDVVNNNSINNNLNYIMDYEYWLRLSKKYKFKNINEVISASRWHSECKTIDNIDAFYQELDLVHSAVGKIFINRIIPPELSFRVFYNLQRLYSMLFLIKLKRGRVFPTIKLVDMKKVLLRQLLGIRYGAK